MFDNLSNKKSIQCDNFWVQALDDALSLAEQTDDEDEKRRLRIAADWFRYRLKSDANPTSPQSSYSNSSK